MLVLAAVLVVAAWTYYAASNLRHLYVLLDCSKGKIALIPKLCRAYLFNVGLTANQVATINYDGSLFAIVATADDGDRPELLRFLLDSGIEVNSRDGRVGIAPLHAAVLDNNVDVARLLLQQGADRSIEDRQHGLKPVELARQLALASSRTDPAAMIDLLEQQSDR